VSLREEDLPLLAGDHLDDRVGQILFRAGGDALGAPLVLEHDRAVLLDLVLPRDRRLLVGVDVLGGDRLRRVLVLFELVAEGQEFGLLREDAICKVSQLATTLRL
jgi:hypothetical protein